VTKREKTLAFLLLPPMVLVGVGVMAHQLWWDPLRAKEQRILTMRTEIEDKKLALAKAMDRKKDLDTYRVISLPRDVDLARLKYEEQLSTMIRAAGFDPASITIQPKPPDSKSGPVVTKGQPPVYTRLEYIVDLKGDLLSLVDFMEKFYKIRLLHKIRNLKMSRPSNAATTRTTDLDIKMTVEALVLEKAEARKILMPEKPPELASLLATPERKYPSIAGRNLFFGPPDAAVEAQRKPSPQFAEFIKFNGYTDGVATLYDEYNNQEYSIRPRADGSGYRVEVTYLVNGRKRSLRTGKTFDVMDEYGELQRRWLVLRAAQREIFLQDDEGCFVLRLGQRLSELQKLTTEEAAKLGLIQEKAEAVGDKEEKEK
jgi:hypothetical protein